MCLILFAYDSHPLYRLIFAANRDEFYDRPTRPARFWSRYPDILAGKDLESGGAWMGVTRAGRFAALTNYREPGAAFENAPSRGFLVLDFLKQSSPPRKYLEKIRRRAASYNGFNLLVGDTESIHYYSNRQDAVLKIDPGIHALSNRLLDTPWPKAARGKQLLSAISSEKGPASPEALFKILEDHARPIDRHLPATGVPLEWERILSPIFVASEIYGTRSSTVILWKRNGAVEFAERSHFPDGRTGPGFRTRRFRFEIQRLAFERDRR